MIDGEASRPRGAARRRRRRPRLTILVKLMFAFVVPTALLFSLFAFVAYEVERRELEAELGRRLEDVASAASTRIRGHHLVDLAPGSEEDLRYKGAQRRIEQVAEATDVARIYIFDRDFLSRADTDEVPIGTKYFQAELDRVELDRVFALGESVSSMLFEGNDGVLYKAGYAPIYASGDDRSIVLAIGVDAPADFFDRLADLREKLVVYGIVLALLVAVLAVIVAARITSPVRSLVDAAGRIGAGDLAQPVARSSRDEIGILAETMEQMRSDLRARDERMQLMLSGIAHEVRNPLGGIELFSGILREELGDDAEKRSHVERIDRELRYLQSVVESFLDYARRPAPQLAAVDLGELCRGVCEIEAADAERAGVELSAEVDHDVACRGDADQLKRALLNLVRNALQAAGQADEARRVVVRARQRGDAAEIAVENTGPPIPEDIRERLFEPFFTTREKGTGLGLAFVREIVADHGGVISVASGPEGTVFAIKLPANRR